MLRWLRRLLAVVIVVASVGVMVAALTPQGRTAYHTLLFITQVVPSLPTLTAFQPDPVRTRVVVPTPEGPRDIGTEIALHSPPERPR